MLPLYKKYWRTAFDIGLIVLTVYLIMLIFSKLYQIAAPVFLSFLVFLIIEPFSKFLHRRGFRSPSPPRYPFCSSCSSSLASCLEPERSSYRNS